MSPLYEVHCPCCGKNSEVIAAIDDRGVPCRLCNYGATVRVPAVRGPNCSNDSASWLPSVLEVVQKDSNKPHVRAFLKDPTRTNYKAWMKGEGLRPFDIGEKPRKEGLDIDRHAGLIMKEKARRERYEVRG